MTTYQRAVKAWRAVNTVPLATVMPWFAEHGVLISTPSLFLMARPWAVGTDTYDTATTPDAWLILLAASERGLALKKFMELAPYPLPTLAWHRRGKLKIWSWDQVKAKLYEHDGQSAAGAQLCARDEGQPASPD